MLRSLRLTGYNSEFTVTLSIVLAIWLAKSNCVLQKKDDFQVRMVENKIHPMKAWDDAPTHGESMTKIEGHF